MNLSEQESYTVIEMPAHLLRDGMDQIKGNLPSSIKIEGRKFVLDMKNVPHIFSAGIGLITQLNKEITGGKGKLYIANANQEVENVLREMNLDKVIPVFSNMIDFEIEEGSSPEG